MTILIRLNRLIRSRVTLMLRLVELHKLSRT
nr:MAG TPA: hypothetical protein [Caudoviricetes sp.]